MDNLKQDPEWCAAVAEKRKEFKQHLNDSVPDRPMTRKQQEQLREALHEQSRQSSHEQKRRR